MHINWHDLNAAWYPLTRRFDHKDDGEDDSNINNDNGQTKEHHSM